MAESKMKKSVLVVDDEPALRGAVCEFLTSQGYDAVESHSGPDAIVKIVQEDFDAIITDIRMPEMSGLDLVHVLDRMCTNTVVILLTAVPDPGANLESLAREAGVFAYINKPCKLSLIKETIEKAFAENAAAGEAQSEVTEQSSCQQLEQSPPIAENTTQLAEEPEKPKTSPTALETDSVPKEFSNADSYFLAEIESIINDTDQAHLRDEDSIKLSFETFSHHYGDLVLNSKQAPKGDFDEVFLKPKCDIRCVSPLEFHNTSLRELQSLGWQEWQQSITTVTGSTSPLDLHKNGVGIKIGLQTTSLRADFINFEKLHKSNECKLELFALLILTGGAQKYLKKTTGKPWSGASFKEAVRTLKGLQRQITAPICILGLDASGEVDRFSFDLPTYAQNVDPVPMDKDSSGKEPILGELSANQIKQLVFDYLETKYHSKIERQVGIKSSEGFMGIDGLMRLGFDVVLEIEMSKSLGLPVAQGLTAVHDPIEKTLDNYRRLTRRKAVMRFILLGEFTQGYLQDLTWRVQSLYENDPAVKIDYEILSYEQLGIRIHEGLTGSHVE